MTKHKLTAFDKAAFAFIAAELLGNLIFWLVLKHRGL